MNFKKNIDTQRINFSCEPCTCTKYVGKPFTRHSIWSLASLWTKSHGARERFTNLYTEMCLPFIRLNDHWMVTEMRHKFTFPVTIQSPFSNHSVIIQSTERWDLTVSFSSSISLIEKKNISRYLENILIPSMHMFRDIQCHEYFVKYISFVILRIRPEFI